MYETDLVFDLAICLLRTKRVLVANWESPELSVYTFKSVYRSTFETLWERLQNLLGMKLTTDVTLLCLSVVDGDTFVYFLCHKYGLWNQLNQRILSF